MFLRNSGLALFILVGAIFLTACPSQTNISKINSDPGHYQGKEIGIAGRVTNSFGLAGNGAYEIDDGSGRMWVATKRGVPSRGSHVGAKGYIHSGFNFAGRNFGTVMEETDRQAK